ncbi:RNA polymerase sigma-70 factor [Ancylomarina longa]|uniref:RNA polymerase sigma-70 factor n=1 Tax=Ancylomarina longa TaxID=2487017 RepID=A0A434AUL5_9BACT|nr:RNA polymerase sigma-70 factor [Ancylomarina longa]RUT78036.1 RNA polymerase sigma-70 factor [Ancylomarina longa]
MTAHYSIPINKLRAGSERTFKELYNKYYDALFLFGQKYIPNQNAVEDIIQESFLKVWEKKTSFFHEAALRAFLYKTVRNSCLNLIEHEKVCRNYQEEFAKDLSSNDFFLNNVIEEEVNRIITDTIQKLPESARLIYLLSLKGLKNVEIAEDLDISINTVKTQKQRANKFLRENLKNLFTLLCFL